jgi:hypothetical protein
LANYNPRKKKTQSEKRIAMKLHKARKRAAKKAAKKAAKEAAKKNS